VEEVRETTMEMTGGMRKERKKRKMQRRVRGNRERWKGEG